MTSLGARVRQAIQLHEWGQLIEAEHAYGELTQHRPDDVELHCRLADVALRTLRTPLAVEIMEQAVALDPKSAALHCRLAMAQREAGLILAAAESFRAALRLAPHSNEAGANFSATLEEMGDFDAARNLREPLGLSLPIMHRMEKAPSRHVVLTIDDGPSPEVTPEILRALKQAKAKASFFVIGKRARAHPDLIAAMLRDGHDVLSHGYSHEPFINDGVDPIGELAQTEQILAQARPTPTPYWIRLPFGAGWADHGLHNRIRAWNPNVVLVQWLRTFYEWHIPNRCFGQLALKNICADTAKQVLRQPTPDGTIFLLHDLPVGAHSPLARQVGIQLLDQLLGQLHAKGLTATSLSKATRSGE